jgi:anthranilate phosphoribosyltransferase
MTERAGATILAESVGKILRGDSLARGEAEELMELLLTGRLTDAEIAGLLSALRAKGETAEELVGFARAMRRHARDVLGGERLAGPVVDTCGTGGDASGTFNVSTAAAIVAAGAGARVAKHGNRSISSRSGSADVLEALGVNVELATERAGECLRIAGLAFLFAPAVHRATRHAMAARRQLGGQTVFNLLGPLTNPAGATAQVAGVYEHGLLEMMAEALGRLGIERALVVHSAEGWDEISPAGETDVAELHSGRVRRYRIAPEDFGLERSAAAELAGGDAAENANIIRGVLAGERGARRNFVVLAAAAALVAAELAGNFREGARQAEAAIDSGRARQALEQLIALTRERTG